MGLAGSERALRWTGLSLFEPVSRFANVVQCDVDFSTSLRRALLTSRKRLTASDLRVRKLTSA